MPFIEAGVRGSMPGAFFENNIMIFSSSRSGIAVWTPLALASALSGLSVGTTYAQSSNDNALPSVVVTASRTEQLQTEALPHTTVITAEEIRKSGAFDIRTLLRREAGIQITQNGGVGSATGLFMRGADTRQTLVLIDGVPMTKQDATGSVSIEQILLEQIDRIEIVRGNVSAIYGSGAIGGVIQIFTRNGKGPAKFNATAEAGSRGTRKLSGGVAGSTGDINYSLQLSTLETDGFSALNPAQNPSANRDDDSFLNKSASGSIAYQLTKDNSIGARFLASDGDTEYDNAYAPQTQFQTQTVRNNLVSVFSKNRITNNWQSDVVLSRFADKYSNLEGAVSSWVDTTNEQLEWNNTFQLNTDWTATAGFAHRDEAVKTSANLDRERKVNAIHGGILGNIGRHEMQANLRYDHYSDVGDATTGYLGYGFEFTENLKATASYSTAFAAAPLGYLFSPGWGNPDLKPEETKTAELGLQYAADIGILRAIVFQSRTSDQFSFGSTRFENLQKVKNKGMELSYSGQLAGIRMNASLTLQEPRDERTGKILNRRARTIAAVGASKTWGEFTLGGDALYTGDRPDQDFSASPTRDVEHKSYWLANLNARYQVSKSVALYGRVENLFDREYQTAYGFNQTPRGVFVGVNWQQ